MRLAIVLLLAAQTATTETSFEVASVRSNTGATAQAAVSVDPGGRLRVTAAPLPFLIAAAYGNDTGALRYEQIIGAPDWLRSERYDITAQTAPEAATNAATLIAMRPFLRALLEERFQLKTHRDTRELPVYALVRSRPGGALGPGLSRSNVDCEKEAARCGFGGGPMGRIKADALTGDLLTQLLASASGRIVVDRTGLKGPFTIDLEWSQDQTASDKPSIFTAVQEQLGLKLESARAPVDVLVIDSVERPTPD
ncbi:MAG TPA: TIGR03435 family protein [Vicinamibacterales bacterium]|nr:TIGR03435 family protein [Vicinamibacterales bacterium]